MILPEKSLHEVELNLLAVVAVGQQETIRCNLLPMDVADRLTLLLANSIKTWKLLAKALGSAWTGMFVFKSRICYKSLQA